MTQFTPSAFDHMILDPAWSGYGYIGMRQSFREENTDPEVRAELPDENGRRRLIAEADALVIEHATRNGWTDRDLFDWANSKHGRWYAEDMFGFGGMEGRRERAARQLTVPTD